MEISYFWEFLILYETKNYPEAAHQLFISEPTLSRHIKALEDELSAPLFERNSKKFALTEFGEAILPIARQFIDLRNNCFFEIRRIKDQQSEVVTITSAYQIHEMLLNMQTRNNNIRIKQLENLGDTDEIKNMLRRGDCEFAFIINLDDPDNEFVSIPYATDIYAAILPAAHPLAHRDNIRVSDLRNENFISFHNSHNCNNVILEFCKQAGFTPNIVCIAGTGSTVASYVKYGGASILMKHSILQKAGKTGLDIAVVDLEPKVEINVSLCYLKNKSLSHPAEFFLEFVTNIWPEMKIAINTSSF